MLASTQVAAATLTVRHARRPAAPRARVDDVVRALAPAPHRGARGGQAAGADRKRLARRIRAARGGHRRLGRSSRRRAAGPRSAMSPPRLTSTPTPACRCARCRCAARSARQRLRGGAEVEHARPRACAPRCDRDRPDTSCQPAHRARQRDCPAPAATCCEVAVVARRAPAPARRGVDDAVGERAPPATRRRRPRAAGCPRARARPPAALRRDSSESSRKRLHAGSSASSSASTALLAAISASWSVTATVAVVPSARQVAAPGRLTIRPRSAGRGRRRRPGSDRRRGWRG